MHRHQDWAVVVALVGGGQEINTGEAGLAEWGRALLQRPEWGIVAPPAALTATDPRQRLFDVPPATLALDAALHLEISVRAIRSALAAPWVEPVLAGKADRAAALAAAGQLPFQLTRSLSVLREVLRCLARGQRRSGLVCSAGARRLVADGLCIHLEPDAVANWFLRRWPDVRASDALELPATQFACQGLELDYTGLAWGNDLIRRDESWLPRQFVGTGWQVLRAEDRIAYVINTYRVLLTRSRYETVIWVPEGNSNDATRDPAEFDAIAAFLCRCGAELLGEAPSGPSERALQSELL